eukprot:3826292-Amphidinium_carterae.1
MQDVLALHAHATRQCTCSELEWRVIDVRDAFYQLPLHPLERKYAVAKLVAPSREEHYYTFLRLPMGGKNPPQVWGRAAALLARLMAGLLPPSSCRLQLYVDDAIIWPSA